MWIVIVADVGSVYHQTGRGLGTKWTSRFLMDRYFEPCVGKQQVSGEDVGRMHPGVCMLRDSYRCNTRTSTWFLVPFASGRLPAGRNTMTLHAAVQPASNQNQHLSWLNNALIIIIG